MERQKRVGLLIDTSTAFGRSALGGVAEYTREAASWSCFLDRGTAREFPEGMRNWAGDGMIATIREPAIFEDIRSKGMPLVNLANEIADLPTPQVLADDAAIGALAAEHFAKRGLKDVGFFGLADAAYTRERCRGFVDDAEDRGCVAHVFPELTWSRPDWLRFRRMTARWLAELPKPVGVLASDDKLGRVLVETAAASELRVPDDVAVVGVDNDAVLCSLIDPPLSSIAPGGHRRGHEAAALLDRLMDGHPPPEAPVRLKPLGLVARGSSDLVAAADPDVARALVFIREHIDKPITVPDVLEVVPVSRRSLELRFNEQLGRTPGAEIRRLRLERAKSLLVDTDMGLGAIARATGLPNAKSLCETFKRATDMTPMTYRRTFGAW